MPKITIYKIECLANGKVYIGQTKNRRKRWDEHKYELRRGIHHSTHLQRAWRKFGEANFKFTVVEQCSQEAADERERHWIDFYDSTNKMKGFNLENGGNRHKKLSDETRQKIGRLNKVHYHRKVKFFVNSPEAIAKRSKSNTGKRRDSDFRRKMSEIASRRTGEANSFFGRKHSEEHKKMLSDRFKGMTRRPPKPLTATHVETGEVLRFSSRKEAEQHGFNRTGICAVLNGKWKSYKGYIFNES
ncbi:GIY-YIG nuclease family protein [Paenibacillus ginsengihumi]|uniref:GIY-YIG nuclease family protein n=1 Tax=Paenibacillus ginsengihumi TaxID=431596 RepID=UPI000364B847|nr:GIY-YIG nuclease family protein [Paenibacillus ginsengihumi]